MARVTQKALAAMGREYLDLQEAKASAEARMKELQVVFREQFDMGPHAAGDAKVSIQKNVTRDDKAFEAAYPFDQYPDFYVPKVDTKTINRELAPAELEKFQVLGAPKVIVTPFEKGA